MGRIPHGSTDLKRRERERHHCLWGDGLGAGKTKKGKLMIRLEKSEALRRKIRQDDLAELVIPTWTLVRDSISVGKKKEALEFVEYGCAETQTMHDSIVSFVDDALTYIARFGEEEVLKFLRERYLSRVKNWLSATTGVIETIQRFAEFQRGHFSEITIVEERDRYVMSGPCGSGGRLRRSKSVATTKKAYPWSWSRENVPYYCLHCCVAWEVIPNEIRGYPLRIHLVPERPENSCVHLFYKKPELIPEEYFTRVGVAKVIK